MMGYTINRVSLFALIFSIGILVDDAIVVVENIVRHWSMRGERGLVETAIEAVAEVGNPTIVATLTIVAALLPMMFVSGLMGPYMSPIPANASMAMLFSFFVAMTITPWLLLKIARRRFESAGGGGHGSHDVGAMGRFYIAHRDAAAHRPLALEDLPADGRRRDARRRCALFATKAVRVKLLPFDNKSEIQVVVDLPRGASLEDDRPHADGRRRASRRICRNSPRSRPMPARRRRSISTASCGITTCATSRSMGDLSVNLVPKGERTRASHAIALDIRKRLEGLPLPAHSSVKVVEVPPGPPVLSTLLAEIYGPDARRAARTRRKDTQGVRNGRFRRRRSTIVSACATSGCGSRSTSKRWNSTASRSRRSMTRSARCSAA